MRFVLFVLTLLILGLSVYTLHLKGYLDVREINVSGREDIQSFITNRSGGVSYFWFDRSKLERTIKDQFSDIHSIDIKRTSKFGLNIDVKELTPLGSGGEDLFVSTTGVVYLSDRVNPEGVIAIDIGNVLVREKVLSVDQVYFIQKMQEEFDIQNVEIVEPFHFIINLSGVSIEVEKDYSNLTLMLDPTTKYVESWEENKNFSSLIILNNRIIVK